MRYFNGFHEENSMLTFKMLYIFHDHLCKRRPEESAFWTVIVFFINLISAVCYFARIISDATCTSGFLMFTGIAF